MKIICSLIEGIIDTGEIINFNYMKYIGPAKYKKNIKSERRYDSKHKGFRLIKFNGLTDQQLSQWCSEHNLHPYECINEIKNIEDLNKYKEFICLNIDEKIYNVEDDQHDANHYIKQENDPNYNEKYNEKLKKITKLECNKIKTNHFGDISHNFTSKKYIY